MAISLLLLDTIVFALGRAHVLAEMLTVSCYVFVR